MSFRYRTMALTFVQNELAFDGLTETRQFLTDHSAAVFINPNDPDEKIMLESKPMVGPLNTAFEEKYRKVQIKGAV